jgi:hypothetical protein
MHQIEILLPADTKFVAWRTALAQELASRFGGVTAFIRAPAKGLFEQNGQQVEDDIVVFEIMADVLEREWRSALRVRLEDDFHQDEIVIRASAIERL